MSSRPAKETPAPALLEIGYYERYFQAIVDTVVDRYGDLLDEGERAFATELDALPRAARRLYIRLISRSGRVLRGDRIAYDEIPDITGTLDLLRRRAFTDTAIDVSWFELAPLLRQDELLALLRDLGIRAPRRKVDRLEALADAANSHPLGATVEAAVRRRLRPVRPLRRDRVRLYRLLFFGGLHQDWTAFVLRDLGVRRYESYALERRLRRFPDRTAIDHVTTLWRDRLAIARAIAEDDLDTAAARAARIADPERAWHDSVRPLAERIIARVAARIERAGARRAALALFERTDVPPSRERRTRLLARLGRTEDAVALAARIAAGPRDERERVFAPMYVRRLLRRMDSSVPPQPRVVIARETLSITGAGSGSGVETRALEALAARGQTGCFAENWLWKSLFGLAFWDIVFAPVPGMFEHPFQRGPLDLFRPGFRERRLPAIRDRLAWLRRTIDLRPALLRRFDEKSGIANAFVSWHVGARDTLDFALGRLHGGHLAWVADRLSRDPRRYRTGFPDLFVTSPRSPGFALYEVKGPGDQLRAEQRGWLRHFRRAGIDARVLDVRFTDGEPAS